MANPTTNYGFVLPTASDLVTDLPADFDVALQGVDTRLKALQPGTTLGDIAYSSATANTNTRLGIGSTGNVLTVAGGVPTWAAPAGGGKVLQVVQSAIMASSNSSSSSTYVDTGLSATITPSSATRTNGPAVSSARSCWTWLTKGRFTHGTISTASPTSWDIAFGIAEAVGTILQAE